MADFGLVMQVGEKHVSRASQIPIPRDGAPAARNFWDPTYIQMV